MWFSPFSNSQQVQSASLVAHARFYSDSKPKLVVRNPECWHGKCGLKLRRSNIPILNLYSNSSKLLGQIWIHVVFRPNANPTSKDLSELDSQALVLNQVFAWWLQNHMMFFTTTWSKLNHLPISASSSTFLGWCSDPGNGFEMFWMLLALYKFHPISLV